MKEPFRIRLLVVWLLMVASFVTLAIKGCTSAAATNPGTASTAPQRSNSQTESTPPIQGTETPLTFSGATSETSTVPSRLTVTAINTPAASQSTAVTALDLPDMIVSEMMQQVDLTRALNDLEQLTGEKPICVDNRCYTILNRDTGSEGLQWAKEYVYKELVDLGYSVELHEWDFEGYTDQNILATKPGTLFPAEEIYIVAHLDGVGGNGGESFPAADDNASGAVDLLELARVLSCYSFSRTVVLMFSTGEEHGSLGTRSYVDELSPDEIQAIKCALSIDMVGYDANQDNVMELWSGDHQPSYDLVTYISDIITKYDFDLSPIIVTDCY